MFKTALIAACAAATLIAGSASAQPYGYPSYAPPMGGLQDMVNNQVRLQAQGDAMVRQYQQQIYQALVAARRAGHPVDGLIIAPNRPNDFNSDAWFANSRRTTDAIEDNNYRGLQGCYYARDIYNNVGYACH